MDQQITAADRVRASSAMYKCGGIVLLLPDSPVCEAVNTVQCICRKVPLLECVPSVPSATQDGDV